MSSDPTVYKPERSAASQPPLRSEIREREASVTVVLKHRELPQAADGNTSLSHDELERSHGAHPSDIEAVRRFATERALVVGNVHAASRTLILRADRQRMLSIFGDGESVARIPAELEGVAIAVLGLGSRPLARKDQRFLPRTTVRGAFSPSEVAKLYNFPTNTGKGQTIALIELAGGFRTSDLNTYWRESGIGDVAVSAVPVSGAKNDPTGDPGGPDGEVALDIQVAGSMAPGAAIAVYFAPNTDQGFLAAVNAAIHDTIRKPSVISISWGSAEREWCPQAMNAFNAAFHDAAMLGISVCVASGDNGSSDGETDGKNHVDFPASSPWVLACGGTRLIASNGRIESETVWNNNTGGGASGGGVSSHFSKPNYQAHVPVPKPLGTKNRTGRGIPDVAGVADPETGFKVLVDGQHGVLGGTSAVAPLWAGLIALCNEQLGHNIGFINPLLYGTASQHRILRDITDGSNGTYTAAAGWDPCTGLGSPDGTALLGLLLQLKK